MSYAIETDHLSHHYGRTEAVHDLTIQVPTGSLFALVGPNGAGKTTTIKTLMNLLQPSAGRATVLGTDSRKIGPPTLARIGYVSENQQLPEWMTQPGRRPAFNSRSWGITRNCSQNSFQPSSPPSR